MSPEIGRLVEQGWIQDAETGNLHNCGVGTIESHASGTGSRFFYAWVAGRDGKPGHYVKDTRGRFFRRFRFPHRAAQAITRETR